MRVHININYFIISLLFFLIGCDKTTKKTSNENTAQKTVLSNPQRLNFPHYSEKENENKGCQNLYAQTPKSKEFTIYGDTTILLNEIDPRLEIEFQINWKYEKWDDLGITDINFVKNGKILSNMSLGGIIWKEASQDWDNNDKAYNEITFTDVNMDTYLDFSMTRECGKGCWDSYFIYNPVKEIFEYEKSWDWMRSQYKDCVGKIIYSYEGGVWNTQNWTAYKIDGNQLIIHQRLERIVKEEHTLEVYRYYKNGERIGSDSLKVPF